MNSLPTEQLTLLLVTIALAVGGLIYFCIHLVRIFPGIPYILLQYRKLECIYSFSIKIPGPSIFIQKEVFQGCQWTSANHSVRFSLTNDYQWIPMKVMKFYRLKSHFVTKLLSALSLPIIYHRSL